MSSALIGFTGYVGSTLLKQTSFDFLYRSTNIASIEGNRFDTVVCAGAPAQKWIANRDPEADLDKINMLISHLKSMTCKTFVLISTVDVFSSPLGVDEGDILNEVGLNPYGLNRRLLEKFVESHFPQHLIIRLPGLVGPGLRKNVIFDFMNNNNLHLIDSQGIFQFYPMVNLWFDIQTALNAGLKLLHLTAAPISVAEVSAQGFGHLFDQKLTAEPATYDFRTRHADLFGGSGHYQYSRRETIQAIRAYVQSEPKTISSSQSESK